METNYPEFFTKLQEYTEIMMFQEYIAFMPFSFEVREPMNQKLHIRWIGWGKADLSTWDQFL